MNRFLKRILSCAAAGTLVLTNAALSVSAQETESQEARNIAVLSIDGKNAVVKKGGKKELKATSGMRLSAGSTVSTGSGTVLYIQADDDKFVKLAENSEVSVSQASAKKLRVSVKSGEIFFNVVKPLAENSELTFTAGNVSMGVRGTSGGISLKPGQDGDWRQVSLTLSSGKVEMVDLLTGSSLPLQAGETGVCDSSAGSLERKDTSAETVSSFFLRSALEQSVTLTTIDPVLETQEDVTAQIQEKAKTEEKQREQAEEQRREIEKSLPEKEDSLTPLNPDITDSSKNDNDSSSAPPSPPAGGGSPVVPDGSHEEDDDNSSGSNGSNNRLKSLRDVPGMPGEYYTVKNVIRLQFPGPVPNGSISLSDSSYHYYTIRDGVVREQGASSASPLVSIENGGKTLVVKREPLGSNSSAFVSAYFSLQGYMETGLKFIYQENVEADGGIWLDRKPSTLPDDFSSGTFVLETDEDEDFRVEFTAFLPSHSGNGVTISSEQYLGKFVIDSQNPGAVQYIDNVDHYLEVSASAQGNGEVQVQVTIPANFADTSGNQMEFIILKKDCPNQYTCLELPAASP